MLLLKFTPPQPPVATCSPRQPSVTQKVQTHSGQPQAEHLNSEQIWDPPHLWGPLSAPWCWAQGAHQVSWANACLSRCLSSPPPLPSPLPSSLSPLPFHFYSSLCPSPLLSLFSLSPLFSSVSPHPCLYALFSEARDLKGLSTVPPPSLSLQPRSHSRTSTLSISLRCPPPSSALPSSEASCPVSSPSTP